MEETVANVCLKVDELHHYDITPHQSVCKEIKNVAVTAEEITENPEYVVMRRSIAVQTVTNEEVVVPKQDPSLNQRSNLMVFSSEGGNTMEIDVSSQESAMDIASQESLSAKESNFGGSHYCDAFASSREEAVLVREEDLRKRGEALLVAEKTLRKREEALLVGEEAQRKREEAVLVREEDLRKREEAVLVGEEAHRKREEAVLDCQEKVRILEEVAADCKRNRLQVEMRIQELVNMLNNRDTQLAEKELIQKKLETAIKICELEAEGYKVIPLSSESCRCLPAKRAKKN